MGRGDARFSARPDDRGRAGPRTAAGSRGVSLTNHSGHDEGKAIHEKEQTMTYPATAWQNGGPLRINAVSLNKFEQGVADAHAGPEDEFDEEHLYPGV